MKKALLKLKAGIKMVMESFRIAGDPPNSARNLSFPRLHQCDVKMRVVELPAKYFDVFCIFLLKENQRFTSFPTEEVFFAAHGSGAVCGSGWRVAG